MDSEYENVKTGIEDLEFRKMLSGEEDQLGAMIDINPGAGGTESQDWAEMLLRMYIMWGENHRYKVREVNYQPGIRQELNPPLWKSLENLPMVI